MQETIRSTKEYSLFKFISGNRSVDTNHVAHLKESIASNNLLEVRPILVNDEMGIIDGQHRLVAAKELGVPIFYIVRSLDLEAVQALNSNTKNWSNQAYLQSYVSQGNKDYLLLQGFIQRWKLSISEGLTMLGGGDRQYRAFRHGHFKARNIVQAEKIMEMVYDFEKWYKQGFRRRSFIMAIYNLYHNPEYDHIQMMKKMEFMSSELVDCVNTSAYLKLLERIYNHKAREIVHFDVHKNYAQRGVPRPDLERGKGGKFVKSVADSLGNGRD